MQINYFDLADLKQQYILKKDILLFAQQIFQLSGWYI